MKKFWSLFKMQLNVHFGASALKYRYLVTRKRIWEPLLIMLAFVSLAPVARSYWGFLVQLFYALKMVNQEFLLVAAGILAGQVVVLVLGFFYVMSAFYYSRDLDRLVPLPIAPGSIVGAKFGVTMVSEWLTTLPITMPMFLVVGLYGGYGLGYWFRAGIAYVMLPVIPLAVVSVVTMLIARATNIPRNREVFRVVTAAIVVLLMVGLNLFINMHLATNPAAVEQLLAQSQGLMQLVGRRFPPALWLAQAMAGQGLLGGWFQLAVVAAISVGAVWVLTQFAQGLFLSGYLQPGGARGRAAESKTRARALAAADFTPSTRVVALFRREWLLLLRTPIWMFNVVGGLIVPFVLVPIILFTQEGSASGALRMVVESSVQARSIVVVVVGGIALFLTGATSLAGSALSREGRFLWVSKSIPAPASDQLLAKGFHALVFGAPVVILMVVVAYLLMSLGLALTVAALVVSLLASVLVTVLGLWVDMYRPNLDWNDPQRAMKSNLNPLISLVISGAIYGVPAGLAVKFSGKAPFGVAVLLSIWLLVAIAATVRYVTQHAEEWYLAMGS